MGVVDNPFSVPSPFRGEVFFLLGGMALARRDPFPGAWGWGGALALLWALPFFYLGSRPEPPPPRLAYAALPREGVGEVRLLGGEGYRVQVWLCQAKGCLRLGWEWAGDGPIRFALPELPPGQYRLRLVLFSQHRLALRPRYTLEEEVGR